jgi:hypothetical protein
MNRMTLEELADRTEVLELMYAYCRFADRGDAAGMVGLFTPDCSINLFAGEDRIIHGPRAYEEALAPLLGKVTAGTHFIANPEYVFPAADEAILHVYMYSWQRFAADMELPDRHRMGRYEVRAVRSRDGWRLRDLRLIVAGEHGGDRECEHAVRPWPIRFEPR